MQEETGTARCANCNSATEASHVLSDRGRRRRSRTHTDHTYNPPPRYRQHTPFGPSSSTVLWYRSVPASSVTVVEWSKTSSWTATVELPLFIGTTTRSTHGEQRHLSLFPSHVSFSPPRRDYADRYPMHARTPDQHCTEQPHHHQRSIPTDDSGRSCQSRAHTPPRLSSNPSPARPLPPPHGQR